MNWHHKMLVHRLLAFRWGGSHILLLLLVIGVGLLAWNAIQFQAQSERTRVASSDNRIWVISQAEVDYQNLLLAVLNLKVHQETAPNHAAQDIDRENLNAQLSTAFDIYYSRIEVLQNVVNSAGFSEELLSDVATLIKVRSQLADIFDNIDPTDPTQLLNFETAVLDLKTTHRRVVLKALDFFVSKAEVSRNNENEIWTRCLIISVALIVTMGTALCIAFALHRQLDRQLARIKAHTTKLKLVCEASLSAAVVTDSTGHIQMFNTAAERIFGYSQAEAQGRNIAEIMIPHHRLARHQQNMRRFRETGKAAFVGQGLKRTTSLHRDGTEFPVELSITLETDALGQIIFIAFFRDISEQITYEKELRAARDKAQENAAAKTMFLATMSHEMRTPLHGLLASLDLIVDDDIDDPNLNLIKIARQCGLRTLDQINDVLELTRINIAEESPSPFVPAQTVSAIIDELHASALNKKNHLFLNVTGASSEGVWMGYPHTFVSIIYNLVGNAIKFTKNGTITVNLAFSTRHSTEPRLCVIVKDDGVGISPDNQARFFKQFAIGDLDQSVEQPSSTGLGLPIAQAGVRKLGGEIKLESALGIGSTFSFEIPLKAVRTDQELPVEKQGTLPYETFDLSCLLVDDNNVNLGLTAQMLRRLGCDVVLCESGEQAVTAANERAFDVIFVDLNMPGGMSGIEAAREIRAQEAKKNISISTVILALTADITTYRSTVPMMDGVLHKPIQLLELQQVLGQYLPKNIVDAGPSKPALADITGNDFSDLFDLIGEQHSIKLLNGVLDDIDRALKAIRGQHADAGDHLHRATGSSAAVGLLELSQHFRQAEDLVNSSANTALLTVLTSIEICAEQASSRIKNSIAQCQL